MDMKTGVLSSAAGAVAPKRKSEEFDYSKAAGPMQGAVGWTPGADSLAQNQLNKMLETGGQYLTAARNKGYQASARRGLSKSSIAGSAGEEAAIGAAAPIATNDAQTFAKSQSDSANNANQMAISSNNNAHQFALTKYNGILSEESQGRDFEFKQGEGALERKNRLDMQTGQQSWQSSESERDRVAREKLQAGQQGWQSGESTKEREARLALQQQQQGWQSGETAAERAARLQLQQQQQGWQSGETAAERTARLQLQQQQQGWQSGETAAERTAREKLQAQDAATREKLQAGQQGWQSGEGILDRESREKLQTGELGFRAGESLKDRNARATEFDRDIALRTKGMGADEAARTRDFALRERAAMDQQTNAGLDRTQRGEELGIRKTESEARLKQEGDRARQAVASDVARTQQTAMDARMRLEADPNMLPEAKSSAIRAIATQAKADITTMIKLSGVNLPDAWPSWLNDFAKEAQSTGSTTGNTGTDKTPNGQGGGSGGGGSGGGGGYRDESGRRWDRDTREWVYDDPNIGVGGG